MLVSVFYKILVAIMMKKLFPLLTCVLLSSAIAQTPDVSTIKPAQIVPTFSQDHVQQIEKIVHNYMVNNPQILIETGKKLEEQERAKEKLREAAIESNISKYKNQLFDSQAPGRIVLGNPNGKIIVVEFTQYQCSHCRTTAPTIAKLATINPDVKLIIVYWPFFGKDAVYTAKAALAAHKQNKFADLDAALLAHSGLITSTAAENIIKSLKTIDSKKLFSDMETKEIDNGLKANFKLAQNLNLIGTPTIIVTNSSLTKFSLIPGQSASFEATLLKSLNEVR